ncbi:M23 family metallopeptidase [Sphingomonas sp.]|uniref:M23 family metallopeptidase n=1 Tax=Sphingomonas sp. TaxID=28214 RepID=UPI002DD6760E|nr:M23 family metallopeptidase [Sphingomonas sp.]
MRAARVAALAVLGGCAAVPQVAEIPPARVQPPPERATQAPARAGFAFEGAMIQGGAVLGTAPSHSVRLSLDGKPVALAADGRFLIAFDRDAAPVATLSATLAGGGEARETLAVAPRDWRIERLPTLPRVSQPSAEFQRRRPGELAQIAAARTVASDSQGWRQRFVWPATGRISGLFGAQRVYAGEPGAYHSGVDVARPTGTPIVAPADGVVTLAAPADFTLEGRLLMLDHGMGLNSAFLHLSRIDVRVGDRVRQGQVIGAIGATGRATGPHMHWGMKWNDARIDPLLLVGPMP